MEIINIKIYLHNYLKKYLNYHKIKIYIKIYKYNNNNFINYNLQKWKKKYNILNSIATIH